MRRCASAGPPLRRFARGCALEGDRCAASPAPGRPPRTSICAGPRRRLRRPPSPSRLLNATLDTCPRRRLGPTTRSRPSASSTRRRASPALTADDAPDAAEAGVGAVELACRTRSPAPCRLHVGTTVGRRHDRAVDDATARAVFEDEAAVCTSTSDLHMAWPDVPPPIRFDQHAARSRRVARQSPLRRRDLLIPSDSARPRPSSSPRTRAAHPPAPGLLLMKGSTTVAAGARRAPPRSRPAWATMAWPVRVVVWEFAGSTEGGSTRSAPPGGLARASGHGRRGRPGAARRRPRRRRPHRRGPSRPVYEGGREGVTW